MNISNPNRMPSAKGHSSLIISLGVAMSLLGIGSAQADQPVKIAVLSAQLQNDHAAWVPTTDAERQRMVKIEDIFKSMLEASGRYKFIPVNPSIQQRIDKDQKMGACAGCEIGYGKEIGVAQVAWIEVQKVSELILNINVYISSVDSGQPIFLKSVDLRGNTDESWQHSMKYLVQNYLLSPDKSPEASR